MAALLAVSLLAAIAAPFEEARAKTDCEEVVTNETAKELYAALKSRETEDGCRLEGLEARRASMRLKWQTGGGPLEVEIVPASCAGPEARVEGAFALPSPQRLDELCGASSKALSSALSALSGVTGEDAPAKLWDPEIWSLEVLYLWVLLPLVWGLLLLACGVALWQRRHRIRPDPLLLGVTGLGLAMRALLPPFGPGDLFNSLADAYRGLGGVFLFGDYVRAPDVLLALVFGVTGASDDVVIALNLVAGTASIPLLA